MADATLQILTGSWMDGHLFRSTGIAYQMGDLPWASVLLSHGLGMAPAAGPAAAAVAKERAAPVTPALVASILLLSATPCARVTSEVKSPARTGKTSVMMFPVFGSVVVTVLVP